MIAVARSRGQPAYWVGGTVRDAILRRPSWRPEMDLAVESAASGFAQALAARLGGNAKWIHHERFGTATVSFGDDRAIDVATTRRESYPRPGALPLVAPAPLREDLVRRDFSVNALAVPVLDTGVLIDPCGGSRDLAHQRLRILNRRSFVDDPTRLLRGVRLEARLGFRMEPGTERAAREAARDALWTVGADRLRSELGRAFAEPRLAPIVERWIELGVWDAVFASPRPRAERLRTWDELTSAERRSTAASAPWSLLLAEASLASAERALQRLGLGDRQGAGSLRGLEILQNWESRDSEREDADRAAEVWRGLEAVEREVVKASPVAFVRERAAFAAERSAIQIEVRGEDLLRNGVAAGPVIGRTLRAVLRARRQRAISAGEELAYALGLSRTDEEA